MTQLLSIFINILAPVFALVLLGYWAGPRLQIDGRSLSRLAYYLLAPAFLFNILSQAEIEAALAARMALHGALVTLGIAATGYVVARLLRCPPHLTAAFVLVAAFGNVGNFGFPIIQFQYGAEALVPASVYFIIMSIAGFVIGVAAASWKGGNRGGAVLAVFKTPAILAVVPAFAVNGSELVLPQFVERSVGLLAGAMIPVMLLTLGVQLAGIDGIRIDRNVVIASVLRLLVGPVLAAALAVPLALSGVPRGVGTLQSAMPVAVLALLIALEHELIPDFVTTVVLVSTVTSALTLTVVLALV